MLSKAGRQARESERLRAKSLLEVEAEEVGRGQLERDAHSGASPRRHVHAAHSRTSFSGPGD